ncbi:MAG: hypothetical protein ACRDWN_07395 [Acidimicrobiales bacterium]
MAIGSAGLRTVLTGLASTDLDEAIEHIMDGHFELAVPDDYPIRCLHIWRLTTKRPSD